MISTLILIYCMGITHTTYSYGIQPAGLLWDLASVRKSRPCG